MHIAEVGTAGPLVIMCHGFPELWYTWRHQLTALAEAGYHAVAPDQRGYGRTDIPPRIEDYNIFQLVGDIVGLVNALGEKQAIVIGHDWGSTVASHCVLLRPDIFQAVIQISVPYLPRGRGRIPLTERMKKAYGNEIFYQVMFQEPGKVDAEIFEIGAYAFMRGFLYTLSANPPPEKRWQFTYRPGEKFTSHIVLPDKLPDWLTEEDVEYFGREYAKTGITGGLNWYRNIDRNWELTPFLDGAKILQPTLFIAGESDAVIRMYAKAVDAMEKNVPDLKGKIILPNAGHWVNQEKATDVNQLILNFLKDL